MKYDCITCNYETDKLSHLNKHYKSQKHLEKVNVSPNLSLSQSIVIIDDFVCRFCNAKFSNSPNLSRHKKTCSEKDVLVATVNQLKEKCDELKNQTIIKDNDLRRHQNYIAKKDDDIRIKDADIRRKDMILEGLIKLCNYDKVPIKDLLDTFAPNAPNLLEFKDMEKFKKNRGNDKYDTVQIAIHYQRRNELHKYVVEVLVNEYHKDKIYEQSIHVTDEQRNNYHIRTNNIWKIDKKGKEMQLKTIDPIINGIKLNIEKYIKENEDKPKEYLRMGENGLAMRTTEELATCGMILSSIDNGVLKTKVITYLKKYLNFDRRMFIESSVYDNETNFKDLKEKGEYFKTSKKDTKQRNDIDKLNRVFVKKYNVLLNDICILDKKLHLDEIINAKSKEIGVFVSMNRLNYETKEIADEITKEMAEEKAKKILEDMKIMTS